MHEFKVWAPRPHKVSVQIGSGEAAKLYEMQGPDELGCWRATVEECGSGNDYGYVLDAGPRKQSMQQMTAKMPGKQSER